MWYEGGFLDREEIWDETREFFDLNENIKRGFYGIDDPQVLSEANKVVNNLYGADMDYVMDNTKFPYIPVDIEVPHEDIFKEANHLLYTSCYTAHRPASSGWLSLAIHGMSSVHTNCPEDYGMPDSAEEDLSTWTDIAKFCPKTVEWMKEEVNYDAFTRVRFMALLPGGWLGNHRDRDSIKGIGATNIAINNPDGCDMVLGDWGKVPFKPGMAVKLNTGYEHSVWNRSEEPRIHMIFDGAPNDIFKRKVNQSYHKIIHYANMLGT